MTNVQQQCCLLYLCYLLVYFVFADGAAVQHTSPSKLNTWMLSQHTSVQTRVLDIFTLAAGNNATLPCQIVQLSATQVAA